MALYYHGTRVAVELPAVRQSASSRVVLGVLVRVGRRRVGGSGARHPVPDNVRAPAEVKERNADQTESASFGRTGRRLHT